MSELAATVREALAALAAQDPARRAFGASRHGYALAPPLDEAALAAAERALDAELPAELREFALEVGGGGAGPAYGWLPPLRAMQRVVEPPGPRDGLAWRRAVTEAGVAGADARAPAWRRAVPVAHLGCAYAAVVPLDGPARGQVWIDARAAGLVAPIAPRFDAFYLDWLDRLARGAWPEGHVPAGACPLAAALGGYFGAVEQQRGLEPGALAGTPLREALEALGPGSIAIAADRAPALFDDGDPVDPCIVCARLLEDLAADGLAPDVLAPGRPPHPAR